MAEASKTVVMGVAPEMLWRVILDYERYPEFVDGARGVKVLSRKKGETRVEYGIALLGKDIRYVLDHREEGKERMSWSLVESNLFKANAGEWVVRDLGAGQCEVTYRLALEFKIYVPGMVLSGLVKSSLPKMLESFEGRARSRNG